MKWLYIKLVSKNSVTTMWDVHYSHNIGDIITDHYGRKYIVHKDRSLRRVIKENKNG